MRTHAPLALILGLFALFSWLFMRATPYRTGGVIVFQQWAPAKDIGAPDERQHANYVRDVMNGKGVAVLSLDDPDLYENYQAHQPPAYYFIAAGWGKLLGADAETDAGGQTLRILSILFGLGTLAGAYFLALWGTGRKDVALGAASFGLMPMMVALHSAISNDPLLFLCCTWAMALMVKQTAQGWTIREALLTGGLIGLGILTKTSAVGLLPILLVAGILSWRGTPSEERKSLVAPALLSLGLALLMAGPWWVRNAQVYGDPLAMSVFNSAFKGSPQAADFIGDMGAKTYWFDMVSWWTGRSFVGVFGYMDVFLLESVSTTGRSLAKSNSVYTALLFLFALLLLAGAVMLGKSDKANLDQDEEVRTAPQPSLWIAIASITVYVVLLIQFNRQYFQGQARYIYPAFGAFALLAGSGMGVLRHRLGSYCWVPLTVVLTVLDYVSWQQLGPAFAFRTALG